MKIIIPLFLLILLTSCTTGNVVLQNTEKEGPFLVINTVDGDTLDINSSERIRMSGINTPEKGDCYYQEAKDKLRELTLNKEVYLEHDITNKDKYGRILRYIYQDGKLVNSILVEEGYARVFDKYKNDTKRYLQLKRVEDTAIKSNLGVWNCN